MNYQSERLDWELGLIALGFIKSDRLIPPFKKYIPSREISIVASFLYTPEASVVACRKSFGIEVYIVDGDFHGGTVKDRLTLNNSATLDLNQIKTRAIILDGVEFLRGKDLTEVRRILPLTSSTPQEAIYTVVLPRSFGLA